MDTASAIWGWVVENLVAIAAVMISGIAVWRTHVTDKKMEKRNLAEDQRNLNKERDDLLDRALQTLLLLDGLEIRIMRLRSDWPEHFSTRELSVLGKHAKDIFPLSAAIREQRVLLKESELTDDLIEVMSNPIRENQILATDMSDIIREQFEARVRDKPIKK